MPEKAQYKFELRFYPPRESNGETVRQYVSPDFKRKIVTLATKLDPKPRASAFDQTQIQYSGNASPGCFVLYFEVSANSQFEAMEIATGVSEQATALDFPGYTNDISDAARL